MSTYDLVFVNPEESSWTKHRFVLWVGSGGFDATHLVIWADHLEDAMEHMCDWCVENAPGYLCDDEVEEEYKRIVQEKLEEAREAGDVDITEEDVAEAAMEEAEVDTTMFGHNGIHYIPSENWGITYEDPTRAQILELQGRPKEIRARGANLLAKRVRGEFSRRGQYKRR